jgi:hypothetical protein
MSLGTFNMEGYICNMWQGEKKGKKQMKGGKIVSLFLL